MFNLFVFVRIKKFFGQLIFFGFDDNNSEQFESGIFKTCFRNWNAMASTVIVISELSTPIIHPCQKNVKILLSCNIQRSYHRTDINFNGIRILQFGSQQLSIKKHLGVLGQNVQMLHSGDPKSHSRYPICALEHNSPSLTGE